MGAHQKVTKPNEEYEADTEAGVKGTKRGYEVHAYDVLSLPTETESIQRGVNGNHNGEPPWGNATGKRYGETLRGNATGMG